MRFIQKQIKKPFAIKDEYVRQLTKRNGGSMHVIHHSLEVAFNEIGDMEIFDHRNNDYYPKDHKLSRKQRKRRSLLKAHIRWYLKIMENIAATTRWRDRDYGYQFQEFYSDMFEAGYVNHFAKAIYDRKTNKLTFKHWW